MDIGRGLYNDGCLNNRLRIPFTSDVESIEKSILNILKYAVRDSSSLGELDICYNYYNDKDCPLCSHPHAHASHDWSNLPSERICAHTVYKRGREYLKASMHYGGLCMQRWIKKVCPVELLIVNTRRNWKSWVHSNRLIAQFSRSYCQWEKNIAFYSLYSSCLVQKSRTFLYSPRNENPTPICLAE